jgi:hypothetical protein
MNIFVRIFEFFLDKILFFTNKKTKMIDTPVLDETLNKVIDKIPDAPIENIKQDIQNVQDNIQDNIQNVQDNIQDNIQNVQDKIQDTINEISAQKKKFIEKAEKFKTNIDKSKKSYLTKLINDYKDAVDVDEVKKKKQRIEIYILKNK